MIDNALHRELYNRALLAAHRSGDPDIIAQVEDAHARLSQSTEVHDASA